MAKSRLQIAKADILKYFDTEMPAILTTKEIAAALVSQKAFWRLAQRTNAREFIAFLQQHGKLKEWNFPFPYRTELRFTWGEVPLLEVLQSLKSGAYFSHYTAMRFHALTEQVPSTIYLNHEQRPLSSGGNLTQSGIDAAFKRRPRTSQNVIEFGAYRICMVNGMFTNQLGVISQPVTLESGESATLRMTNLERTLIDAVVRPAYSGGIHQVRQAFELAKDSLSVNSMAALLKKIGYVYPYHQAIGYYLERTGYRASQLDIFRQFPREFDFYLANQLDELEYNASWRIFVPRQF